MGTSDSFKTEISICSIYDTDIFILNYELTASKRIEALVPKIRNHYRITQEYPLLADFLTRKIKENVLPYFSQYKTSKDVLINQTNFKLDNTTEITERNSNLVLYCELANNKNLESSKILASRLTKMKDFKPDPMSINENELNLNLIQEGHWTKINEILAHKRELVFKKLKLKFYK